MHAYCLSAKCLCNEFEDLWLDLHHEDPTKYLGDDISFTVSEQWFVV